MGFWHDKIVTARKFHLCDECGKIIAAGEQYNKSAGINTDGDFGEWKSHLDCLGATLAYRKSADLLDDEWSPVSEWIWEADGPGLAWVMMDHPTVYARFSAELAEHGREPNPYCWVGMGPYTRKSKPYVWKYLS